MWAFVQRLSGKGKTRAFGATVAGRRWEGAKSVESLSAVILAGATIAARRAGYYRNGLYLNRELADRDDWVEEAISARTDALAKEVRAFWLNGQI